MAMYPFEKYYAPEWETIKTLDALNEILSDNKTIWLVYIFQDHMESLYPEIMSSINQDFTVAKKFPGTLNGGSVYVCVNDKSQRLNTYF
ncbi:acyl-ACP thioesterase [Candidatus Scalindua japonica]|uniref:Acyl-ACP thioesterase n=2 Tax=Candidatus Scalindua japonica TaxID=1284222 RepID=A0A286TX42_9BACT|nr:acyl-ACP thioesterase [Candidatus Scalindua japonica]